MKNVLKTLLVAIAGIALGFALTGCATKIAVPPGSLTSWHHIGSYGPFLSDDVAVQDVTKNPDGSFTVGHYEGKLTIMGFGPHDIIDGLHIDASGTLVPASTMPAAAK